ncbi:MAG: copper resistance CopC family protein [Leifsonia sp.]
MRPRIRRRFGLLGAGVALVATAVLGSAGPASAHNYPVGSSPADGATVTTQPGTISLTTNDNLLAFGGASAMVVSGPASDPRFYGDGCSRVVDATIETEAQLGQPGTYTVTWQVVSTDGHPVSGDYTFEWAPQAGTELADGSASAPGCAAAGADAPRSGDGTAAPVDTADPAAALGDLLWIGGALVAVVAAIGVTLLLLRRKAPTPPQQAAEHEDPPAEPEQR